MNTEINQEMHSWKNYWKDPDENAGRKLVGIPVEVVEKKHLKIFEFKSQRKISRESRDEIREKIPGINSNEILAEIP